MPERRGLVVGCGGTLGFAWSVVVLRALEQKLGWDARDADVLVGTSAGSELVAMLGSGRSVETILAALEGGSGDPVVDGHLARHPGKLPPAPRPGLPARGLVSAALRGRVDATAGVLGLLPTGRGDAGWLRDLGESLTDEDGWVAHPATWLVAADARTGRRVPFGSPDAPKTALGDALAASWAIPGWFPPVQIADRRYVDGGTVSTASVDLVAGLDLDEVVVIAPMATAEPTAAKGLARAERVSRRRMTAGLDSELASLGGTRVIRLEPGQADLDAMGWNFMDLERRDHVASTARRTSPTRVRAALDHPRQGAPA